MAKIWTTHELHFFKIACGNDQSPMIDFSVSVNESLCASNFVKGVKLMNKSALANITSNSFKDDKVCTFTDFHNILAVLQNLAEDARQSLEEETIMHCVLLLKELPMSDPVVAKKIGFITEQLHLVRSAKHSRRFSSDLLVSATLWRTTSSSLYKQLLQEACLTLPSVATILRLSSSLSVDTGLSSSSIAYLKARIKNLGPMERCVSILTDEVYVCQRLEYTAGKVYGLANGDNLAKTMLCFHIKSVATKFEDMVALVPVNQLTSEVQETLWKKIVIALTEIGFIVVASITDGHAINVKMNASLESQANSSDKLAKYALVDGRKIFTVVDPVHLFKNHYTNALNRKVFKCPDFIGKTIQFDQCHVEKLFFEKEHGKIVRIAHKLSNKVIRPPSIERSNVQLSDAFFHHSTNAGLEHYAATDERCSNWQYTANFLSLFRRWFNILNVKSLNKGFHKRDPSMVAINALDHENMAFLKTFGAWMIEWNSSMPRKFCFSAATMKSTIQTSFTMPELVQYLLSEQEFSFVLTGNISSDPIEGRFGAYRYMSGSNYYISVRQILESERALRVRNLLKFSHLNLKDVKLIFEEVNEEKKQEIIGDLAVLLGSMEEDIERKILDDADENVVFYVAGYLAANLSKRQGCHDCFSALVSSITTPSFSFDPEEVDRNKQTHERLLQTINRGGLVTPTSLVFEVSCLAWQFTQEIIDKEDVKKLFLSFSHQQQVFVNAFLDRYSNFHPLDSLLNHTCGCGMKYSKLLRQMSLIFFNIAAKNIIGFTNNRIHSNRKRNFNNEKNSNGKSKVKKLSSC